MVDTYLHYTILTAIILSHTVYAFHYLKPFDVRDKISGAAEPSGYIVSHERFDKKLPYDNSLYNTLALTDLEGYSQIRLKLIYFNIGGSDTCKAGRDLFRLSSYESNKTSLLYQCGDVAQSPPSQTFKIPPAADRLLFVFTTDNSEQQRGFVMNYTLIPKMTSSTSPPVVPVNSNRISTLLSSTAYVTAGEEIRAATSKMNKTLIIALTAGSATAMLIIIVIVLTCIILSRRRKKRKSSSTNNSQLSTKPKPRYDYVDINLDSSSNANNILHVYSDVVLQTRPDSSTENVEKDRHIVECDVMDPSHSPERIPTMNFSTTTCRSESGGSEDQETEGVTYAVVNKPEIVMLDNDLYASQGSLSSLPATIPS